MGLHNAVQVGSTGSVGVPAPRAAALRRSLLLTACANSQVPEPVGNRLTWPGSLIVFQPGLELTALGQAALRMEGHACNPVSIPLMHTASHLLGWGPQLQAHAAVMNVSDVDL